MDRAKEETPPKPSRFWSGLQVIGRSFAPGQNRQQLAPRDFGMPSDYQFDEPPPIEAGEEIELPIGTFDANDGEMISVPRLVELPLSEDTAYRERILEFSRSALFAPSGVEIDHLEAVRSGDGKLGRLTVFMNKKHDGVRYLRRARVRIAKAVDDTGAELTQTRGHRQFEYIDVPCELTLPKPEAGTLRELTGVTEQFDPKRDPGSVFEVTDFVGKAKLKVSHPSLKAVGAKVTIVSVDELRRLREVSGDLILKWFVNSVPGIHQAGRNYSDSSAVGHVIVVMQDDRDSLLSVRFSSKSGRAYAPVNIMYDNLLISPKVSCRYVHYEFSQELPQDVTAKFTVATPESIITTPFSFKNVTLP